ncbi:MAG: murein hydrolase activator EnvC family protein [Nitriliruptoraceae bacterium]
MSRGAGFAAAAMLLTASLAVPAATAQTLDDLDDVERRVAELTDDLEDTTSRVEATRSAIELVHDEIDELERMAGQLEDDVAVAERKLGNQARTAFMQGAAFDLETLLAAEGPQAAIERASLLAALQRRDQVRVESATAMRQQLETTEALIEQREDELDRLEAALVEEEEALQAELAGAESQAQELRSLTARQRRVDRGDQQGIYACIFDRGAHRFRDTWGAPRSGGRSHKGTDVFAAYRQPVYAFTTGVIQRRSNSGLGGIGLYLRGDDGNVYYYAHLASIADDAAVGTRVTAGELVAYNGDTGNARGGAPHVHFELHPGGGAPINPYPWLAAACY